MSYHTPFTNRTCFGGPDLVDVSGECQPAICAHNSLALTQLLNKGIDGHPL
jgi:hypothetical protein